jgi:hypothetical protein
MSSKTIKTNQNFPSSTRPVLKKETLNMDRVHSKFLNQLSNDTVGPGKNSSSCQSHNQWAIILAGGEEERMKPFIQNWSGCPTPKQYCTFVGERSMLQHTCDQADRVGQPEIKMTVIEESHSQEIFRHVQVHTKGHLLIQPKNCETAAGFSWRSPISIMGTLMPL